MATSKSFIDFIVDQLQNAGSITHKKMFGEYGIYSDGKIVALVCDNRLYVKPTAAGRAFLGAVVEAPPYPGAKAYFLIEDRLEDGEWLGELIRTTAEELPKPAPKKPKVKK